MKYCAPCKLRGKKHETVCSRCGKPFRQLGADRKPARASTAETPGDQSSRAAETVRFDLAGLEHRVSQSAKRVRWLASLAALMLLLLGAAMLYARYRYIMQFAEVNELTVERPENGSGVVSIAYSPTSDGKIEFIRRANHRVETVVDHAQMLGIDRRREFRWSDNAMGSIEVQVRHRKGWKIVTAELTDRDV